MEIAQGAQQEKTEYSEGGKGRMGESQAGGGMHQRGDNAEAKAHGRDDNAVYIGKKEIMGYVLAVVTQFNRGASGVSIKARGKAISRAVDVAEIVRNRFLPNAKVLGIAIKTEELQREDGRMAKVSAIEITLGK